MRGFEKVSLIEFKKYFLKEEYESINIPKRATKSSAGYDFYALNDYELKPKETLKIATGIKAFMNNDEVLLLVVRSSIGFKYNVRLVNQVGVIDADYYNNPDNEGHIFIKLHNHGEESFFIKKGDRLIQGIFIKYLTVDNEEQNTKARISGIGGTGE